MHVHCSPRETSWKSLAASRPSPRAPRHRGVRVWSLARSPIFRPPADATRIHGFPMVFRTARRYILLVICLLRLISSCRAYRVERTDDQSAAAVITRVVYADLIERIDTNAHKTKGKLVSSHTTTTEESFTHHRSSYLLHSYLLNEFVLDLLKYCYGYKKLLIWVLHHCRFAVLRC